MRKHCSNVCKLCTCLATESTNSERTRTTMTAALQWQYSQVELIFWITTYMGMNKVIIGYSRQPSSSLPSRHSTCRLQRLDRLIHSPDPHWNSLDEQPVKWNVTVDLQLFPKLWILMTQCYCKPHAFMPGDNIPPFTMSWRPTSK